jgi:ParB/RepB/Spo0J family partition protein
MAKSIQKIMLSASRDIPFDKLVLSQSNVRRVKAGVSIEELAADIARRTLLQSITVRPVLDEHGAETGMFEIPAGGRRFRALELLVKQKRLAKTTPIPCVVRTDGIAEEDSLAENVQRTPLHPLDQFRAFMALREKGQTEEEIAAAFFVAASVVKQRLRLASVAPALLDVYAEDGMTLDQLMAFSVSPDHARQEQVWEAIQRSHNKESYQIRRLLTEGSVRASDKRAQYAGAEYVEAGGSVMRDLFQADDGGWLDDLGLLDRLVGEKLARDADAIRPLSDKLLTELTAFRTLALREAVGNDPGIAFLALLHVLTLRLFYRYGLDSCLEIEPKSVMFGNQAPGLADTPLAARVDARHESWAQQLPEEPGDLWEVLQTFDSDSRDALFAHCVSLTINAVHEAWNRRPKALAHANTLAEAVSLDMIGTGWVPTADNYLGRVSKARILEAVREAKGDQAADPIAGLKKADMVVQAEELLSGTGWLPEPLRTTKAPVVAATVAMELEESVAEAETSADSDALAAE